MRVTHIPLTLWTSGALTAEQSLGAQVKEARERRGWSQDTLVRHLRDTADLEVHQTAIARLERGERAIRFNEAAALAELLGIDLGMYSVNWHYEPISAADYEPTVAKVQELGEALDTTKAELWKLDAEYQDRRNTLERDVTALSLERAKLQAAVSDFELRTRG